MRPSEIAMFLGMMAPTVVVAAVAIFTLILQLAPGAPASAQRGRAGYTVAVCAGPAPGGRTEARLARRGEGT